MNYGAIKFPDIANGPGVRVSLFVSGCTHHCKGCFQPETWDFEYGQKFDDAAEKKILNILQTPYIAGLTLLGGEPFDPENSSVLLPFVRRVRVLYPDITIWAYTGYTIESLPVQSTDLLAYIDVLIDGPFIEDLKDITLQFRGSSNQRLVNVPLTLKSGMTTLWKGSI